MTVSGWGSENENGSAVNELRKVDMTLIPVDACREFYNPWGHVMLAKQVCAYHLPAGGKGQCRGDSGQKMLFHWTSYMHP